MQDDQKQQLIKILQSTGETWEIAILYSQVSLQNGTGEAARQDDQRQQLIKILVQESCTIKS